MYGSELGGRKNWEDVNTTSAPHPLTQDSQKQTGFECPQAMGLEGLVTNLPDL